MSVICLCLGRKTADQRRPETYIRNLRPDCGDPLLELLSVRLSAHLPQNVIGCMLNRHVDVMKNLRLRGHHVDQFIRYLFRIAVKNPDPAVSVDPAEFPQKFRQHLLSVEIDAVQRRFLGHKNELLHALGSKCPCFLQEFVHGNGAIRTAHIGNDAVRASLAAPFRDLEVFRAGAGRKNALFAAVYRSAQRRKTYDSCGAVRRARGFSSCGRRSTVRGGFPGFSVLFQNFRNHICDFRKGRCSQHSINLGHFLQNVLTVPLRKAPGHNKGFQLSVFLPVRKVQNAPHAFLLRIFNKAAGIDYRNICCFEVFCKIVPALRENTQHFLRIHQVLVAAEGHKVNIHTSVLGIIGRSIGFL